MVFFSHIAFMFQKKGISHFWQASASAHSGVCTDIDGKYEEARLDEILQLRFQKQECFSALFSTTSDCVIIVLEHVVDRWGMLLSS